MAPDPGDNGFSRRFLHKKAMFNPAMSPELRSLPVGDKLMEKLRGMDIIKDRIKLDGLNPPATPKRSEPLPEERFSVEDARKLLKLAQLEMVKSKLRQIEKSWITKAEFVQICGEACSDADQGIWFAKTLDDSGIVIVLGNVVYLRPEQVQKKFLPYIFLEKFSFLISVTLIYCSDLHLSVGISFFFFQMITIKAFLDLIS